MGVGRHGDPVEILQELQKRLVSAQRGKSAGLITDARLEAFYRTLVAISQRCRNISPDWHLYSANLEGYPSEGSYVSMTQVSRPPVRYRGPFSLVRLEANAFHVIRCQSRLEYYNISHLGSDTTVTFAASSGASLKQIGAVIRGLASVADTTIESASTSGIHVRLITEREPVPAQLRYV